MEELGAESATAPSPPRGARDDPTPATEVLRRAILEMQAALTAIEPCRKPVVATVHGACVGGSIEIVFPPPPRAESPPAKPRREAKHPRSAAMDTGNGGARVLSLRCGVLLWSMEEAQAHTEATKHANFSEYTEIVLNLVHAACGKPCRFQTMRSPPPRSQPVAAARFTVAPIHRRPPL